MGTSRIRKLVRRADAFAIRRSPPRHLSQSISAMTLVEVMIGFGVIGMASLAALSSILFSWRLSDSNLRTLSAMETARGVAEQAITLDFATLAGATLPIDVPGITSGAMDVGVWNDRTHDVHNTPSHTADDLVMSIMPEVAFGDDGSGARCAQIIVHYRWEEHSFFAPRVREDAISLIRSPVSSY